MVKHAYIVYNAGDLATERVQLADEGKDMSSLEGEYRQLEERLKKEDEASLQEEIGALLDKSAGLPMKKGYAFVEPSDLEGIRAARPKARAKLNTGKGDTELYDRVLGAWLGRCAGCLLGKPVEGWRSERIWGYLKDQNLYPLKDYMKFNVPSEVSKKYEVDKERWRAFIDLVDHMVEDDDTNYTVTGLALFKKHGGDFKPDDVATFWMENIPLLHTYTAERAAYRNFIDGYWPPASASYRNVYREWIGAQIRADFFGYAALGDPGRAAGYAWRDASISHVKNGIYGEMWVAAMLAAAPFLGDIKAVLEAGLAEIPEKSRLTADVHEVMDWHAAGIDLEEAIQRIHKRWNEKTGHHWCHTNSNAQIVTLGLLWGGGDLEKSICGAVQAAFDTDCNGATVGSVVGMMRGARALPDKWIKPLDDRLDTGVAGYNKVKISEVAREGFEIYKKLR